MNASDLTNFDPERIIGLLIEQQVDFVIIGGLLATDTMKGNDVLARTRHCKVTVDTPT